MFAKKNRLSKAKEIKRILKKGKKISNPFFALIFVPRPTPIQNPRFTIVVSTKVEKAAARRNRLKRITRELLKKYLNQMLVADYVIILKKALIKSKEQELLKRLKQTIIQQGLLTN